MEAYRCIAFGLLSPDGERRIGVFATDQTNHPYLCPSPSKGEGIRALPTVGFFISRSLAQPQAQFSKDRTKETKGKNFFKIRGPLHCPIFVSFATFVVRISSVMCCIHEE